MFALVVSISGGTQPGSTSSSFPSEAAPGHPNGDACGGPVPRQADKVALPGSGWLRPPGRGCSPEDALRDGSRGAQVTEGPDGVAARRIRLPGPASPPAGELAAAKLTAGELTAGELATGELAAEELIAEGPGLLMGGRLDLAEITRLTLAAIVPRFAGRDGQLR